MLEPACGEWTADGPGTYRSSDYELKLHLEQPEKGLFHMRFELRRSEGARFTVRSYSLRRQVPLLGIYRLWSYRGGSVETMVQFDSYTRGLPSGEKFAQTAAANTGIPLVVATDREGRNRFAMGMLDQTEVTGLRIGTFSMGKSERGEGLNFTFEFERPTGYSLECTALNDGARLDLRGLNWFDTIAQYTAWVERTLPVRVLAPPAAAWEPIWNTWYPFGQAIDEKIIRDNAAFCKRTGITTVCIDAGYNNALTKGMATPADIDEFNAHTGDWTADPAKFPRFRAMVDDLHAQGHKVTVWVALFMVGRSTRAYAERKHMLIRNQGGKAQTHLCARHPDTAGYLAETFLKLARDYNLDGFWLDFMDGMHGPCYADHPHDTTSPGEAYNRCLGAVRDAVLGWRSDFIIETRMKMSNINAKQFVNALETTDMPFDFDLNRCQGLYLRSWAKGSSVKIDPAQWHIQETDENVAKSCATVTLAGVPVFGVDFRLLPESHLKVIAAWMKFYRAHQADLAKADCRPVGFSGLLPQFRVKTGKKSFHYVGSAATAPVSVEGDERIWVVNASDTNRVALVLDGIAKGQWKRRTLDCFLEPKQEGTLTINAAKWALDTEIPQGGMLVLERV